MKKYLLKSKKSLLYAFFVIIDALNISYMAILLKNTLDAATEGNLVKLKKIMMEVILFVLFYSAISFINRAYLTALIKSA